MREREWETTTDLYAMLAFLAGRGEASDRKMRLFGAACCRRLWPLLQQDDRRAVEVAERAADGRLRSCSPAAWQVVLAFPGRLPPTKGDPDCFVDAAVDAAWDIAQEALAPLPAGGSHLRVAERIAQLALLRDVFGPLLFRRRPPLPPCVLAFSGGLVAGLANTAYEERVLPAGTLDPDRLAVLADALEDAGCTDTEVLEHLRGPGPHVRGCWCIDWLTGRE
jgi:hypothetical protein